MKMFIVIVGLMVFVCSGELTGQINADSSAVALPDSTNLKPASQITKKRKKRGPRLPFIYFHAFGGFGMALAFSEDIEEIFDNQLDLKGSLIGQYGARAGISNVAQFQFFRSDGDHNLTRDRARLKLDFNTEEYLLKVNPEVWDWFRRKREATIFLVAGYGDLEWIDEDDDGFFGTMFTLGAELVFITENVTMSIGLKRKQLTMDTITLSEELFEFDAKGSQWVLDMTLGLGFGR